MHIEDWDERASSEPCIFIPSPYLSKAPAGCDCKGGNEPDCGCRNVPTLGPQVAIDATPMLHRPKAAWRMKVLTATTHVPLPHCFLTYPGVRCAQVVMPEPASLRFLIILREVPLFLLPPFPSTAFLVIRCPRCVHRQETPSLMCSRAPARLMDWSVFSCSDSFPPPPTSHEQPVQRAVSHFSMLNVLAGRGEAWAQVLSPQAAGGQALRRYVVGLWRC